MSTRRRSLAVGISVILVGAGSTLAVAAQAGGRGVPAAPIPRYLVVEGLGDRQSQIEILGAAGNVERVLDPSSGRVRQAIWSPGDSLIAFISGSGVYVQRADGTHLRRLSYTLGGLPCAASCLPEQLAWSPDGQSLAVSSFNSGFRANGTGTVNHGVVTISLKTRRSVDIAPGSGSVIGWSPDGGSIAYETWTRAGIRLVLANADGTHPRTLFAAGVDSNPADDPDGIALDPTEEALSPDGRSLAFTTQNLAPADPFLGIVDVASGAVHPINGPYGGDVPFVGSGLPVWSPDSGRVAVTINNVVSTVTTPGGDSASLGVVGSPVAWTRAAGLVMLDEAGHQIYTSRGGRQAAQLLFQAPSGVTIAGVDPT